MPPSLGSICIMVWEEMPFDEFQDGHLGCRNGMHLIVLNFHVSLNQVSAPSDLPFWSRCRFKILVAILDIGRFGLDATYHSGTDDF